MGQGKIPSCKLENTWAEHKEMQVHQNMSKAVCKAQGES